MHRIGDTVPVQQTRAPHPTFVLWNAERGRTILWSPPTRTKAPRELICGTGEMADLTRAFDWADASRPDRTVIATLSPVNTLLASGFMFLWWGDQLTQRNDAYRPSIAADKHPRHLAQRHRDLA